MRCGFWDEGAGAAPAGPPRLGGGIYGGGIGIMSDEQSQAAHPAMMSPQQQAAADSSGKPSLCSNIAQNNIAQILLIRSPRCDRSACGRCCHPNGDSGLS